MGIGMDPSVTWKDVKNLTERVKYISKRRRWAMGIRWEDCNGGHFT